MEEAMIRNRDIIMLGIQPWDIEIGSNFKNMAIEMARHNRVLYVNRPLDRFTAWRERKDQKTIARQKSIRKRIGVLELLTHNLWIHNPTVMLESINWLPHGKLYSSFNKKNNLKLANSIRAVADQLSFKDPLLIVDNDFYNGLYLKEYLDVDFMMYYLRDFLLSQPYFAKHGIFSEPEILKKADVVTTNSTYLADYASKYNAATYYIGQGCEVDEFVKKPGHVPDDIRSISKPIIGYCGALLSLRLDIAMLTTMAEKRKDWNFVLIGPEDADFAKSKLHQLPNVFFLGGKPPASLPAYVHYFDVCLNPQVINQMTIGNYPRKIDEYLAAGKPVVATTTDAMNEFKDYVYLCEGADEYIAAIEKALVTKDDVKMAEARVAFANTHTWEASVNKLYQAVIRHQK